MWVIKSAYRDPYMKIAEVLQVSGFVDRFDSRHLARGDSLRQGVTHAL